jgi:hypothetical protein
VEHSKLYLIVAQELGLLVNRGSSSSFA